jgi:hypothetical protein
MNEDVKNAQCFGGNASKKRYEDVRNSHRIPLVAVSAAIAIGKVSLSFLPTAFGDPYLEFASKSLIFLVIDIAFFIFYKMYGQNINLAIKTLLFSQSIAFTVSLLFIPILLSAERLWFVVEFIVAIHGLLAGAASLVAYGIVKLIKIVKQ